MYKFLLCRPDPKFSDTGWYLELRPNDLETLMDVHGGVTRLYYTRFNTQVGYDPLTLAANWLATVGKQLMKGETLVVNVRGGWLSKDEITVEAEHESEELKWPTHFDDEAITILQWPGGSHWYLCSNKFRLFSPDNYRTYEGAYEAARGFVSEDNINRREK